MIASDRDVMDRLDRLLTNPRVAEDEVLRTWIGEMRDAMIQRMRVEQEIDAMTCQNTRFTFWGASVVALLQFGIAVVRVFERKPIETVSAVIVGFVAALAATLMRFILHKRFGAGVLRGLPRERRAAP